MIIKIIILILAIPAGFFVSYLARDELVQGRNWFLALIILSGICGIVLSGFGFVPEALTSFFVTIFSIVSYWKSFDKKWTRKKY